MVRKRPMSDRYFKLWLSSSDFSILEPVVISCINSIEHQVNNPGKYFSEIDHLILTLDEANHPISMPDNIKATFNQEVRIPYLPS